jgi:GIY-YIG catalytic domain
MPRVGVPVDVAAIRAALAAALNVECENGKKVGDAKFGAYAFYDYDGEPIYVGQTSEKLRVRIRRHLTNHRTDAVAMNVLDPFEVYEVEMWPLWDLQLVLKKQAEEWKEACKRLSAAEYTVFQKLLAGSSFHAILNEKDMVESDLVVLPSSVRICIIPEELREARKHPDVRIARRAGTIASLAKVISERDVSPGLRRTLLTQAKRLEGLASTRFAEFAADPIETESEE